MRRRLLVSNPAGIAVIAPGSGSPATPVAQRIHVERYGLLQSEPISIFGISARTFRLSSDFLPIRFLYLLFSQLFLGSANSEYFSKSIFLVNIRRRTD